VSHVYALPQSGNQLSRVSLDIRDSRISTKAAPGGVVCRCQHRREERQSGRAAHEACPPHSSARIVAIRSGNVFGTSRETAIERALCPQHSTTCHAGALRKGGSTLNFSLQRVTSRPACESQQSLAIRRSSSQRSYVVHYSSRRCRTRSNRSSDQIKAPAVAKPSMAGSFAPSVLWLISPPLFHWAPTRERLRS
jgi:hypothetical protein